MVDTGTTIFVVDDDYVQVFDSAQAFLNSDHQQRKGLLVLDVRMPGMDGLELQRHLADSRADMPIIFISAHEDVRAHEKAMEAGALAFLQKPLDARILFDAIERERLRCR